MGGRSGTRLRAERRARRVQDDRRRQDVEQGAVPQRLDRDLGPRPRPVQSRRPVRGLLAGAAQAVAARVGRTGGRDLQVHGRGGALDRADAQSGVAVGPARQHRARHLTGEAHAAVGADRGGRGRRVPLGGRRCDVAVHQQRAEAAAAAVVLLAHLRRLQGHEHRIRAQCPPVQVGRRRRDVQAHAGAPRGQPRHVDRAERPAAHDRRERRRRERIVQRRQDLDRPGLRDRAVLPRDHHQPFPVPRVRRPAGQLGRVRSQPLPGWDRPRPVVRRRRGVGSHPGAPRQPRRHVRRRQLGVPRTGGPQDGLGAPGRPVA